MQSDSDVPTLFTLITVYYQVTQLHASLTPHKQGRDRPITPLLLPRAYDSRQVWY